MLVTVPLIKIPYVENFPTFSEKQGMNALAQLAQTDFVFLSWDPQRPRKLIAGPLCHCRPWSCWQHDGPFEIRKRNRGKKKMTGWIKKKSVRNKLWWISVRLFFPPWVCEILLHPGNKSSLSEITLSELLICLFCLFTEKLFLIKVAYSTSSYFNSCTYLESQGSCRQRKWLEIKHWNMKHLLLCSVLLG